MLARWQRTITDTAGNIIAGATVTVRLEIGGAPLASLFTDRDGLSSLANPFTADSEGFASFHVAGGAYRIDVSDNASPEQTETLRYVGIGLEQESDGDLDAQGPGGTTVVGQLAGFSGIAGITLRGEDLGDSPPTPVRIGTDAQVRSSEAGRVIHAGHLETAAAGVALTDAATIAVNWDAGFYRTVTLTSNRVLGNPTNGKPGTFRNILVEGDNPSPPATRELTFGNQYGGALPTLNDVSNTKKYLLTLFCKTSTQFLVTAIDGSDA